MSNRNRLSERLLRIAHMVQACDTLADVGCDHGYLAITLVKEARVRRAIATDINAGPLLRAQEHIAFEKLGDYIETRRSDGFARIAPGEADAAVIAGLGGNLMIDMLSRGRAVVRGLGQLVLGPQSELSAVRAFLRDEDYRVWDEDLVLEDGKFYPLLCVKPQEPSDTADFARESGLPVGLLDAYGHRLLAARHPMLRLFLEREYGQCVHIDQELARGGDGSERIAARREALRAQMEQNRAAAAFLGADKGRADLTKIVSRRDE